MGLSAAPRLVTFVLKFVSFPLMLRRLGATEFGVVVYIGAVISILESFVDLGVSSAAGKEIAIARETGAGSVALVVRRWARLQAIVALIGLGPLLGITYVLASGNSNIESSFRVVSLLVLASWITISLNFVRAALASILAFKSLGVLDSFESLIRSAGWLAVGYLIPTTFGFALTSLIAAGGASVFGVVILWRLMRHDAIDQGAGHGAALHVKSMLKESFNFLWLRLITRVFQSIPIMILGRMFGSEVVGVVGGFARIVELINFPFAVIGSALAVRAPGVLAKGYPAARMLWNAVSRFMALSLMLTASTYLATKLVGTLLLGASRGPDVLLAVLSVTILTSGISSVVAPMSDYVGALRSRNILMTIFSFGQIPLIWLGARMFGELGAVIAYVLVLTLMKCGYLKIALTVFFPTTKYHLRSEVVYFLLITSTSLVLATLSHRIPGFEHLSSFRFINVSVIDVGLFWLLVLMGMALYRPARRFFLSRGFFDFSDSRAAEAN
jgi:O-antigen/teichoic acid export membrane protein